MPAASPPRQHLLALDHHLFKAHFFGHVVDADYSAFRAVGDQWKDGHILITDTFILSTRPFLFLDDLVGLDTLSYFFHFRCHPGQKLESRLPRAAGATTPVVCSAVLFHWVTRPSVSTPTIVEGIELIMLDK